MRGLLAYRACFTRFVFPRDRQADRCLDCLIVIAETRARIVH